MPASAPFLLGSSVLLCQNSLLVCAVQLRPDQLMLDWVEVTSACMMYTILRIYWVVLHETTFCFFTVHVCLPLLWILIHKQTSPLSVRPGVIAVRLWALQVDMHPSGCAVWPVCVWFMAARLLNEWLLSPLSHRPPSVTVTECQLIISIRQLVVTTLCRTCHWNMCSQSHTNHSGGISEKGLPMTRVTTVNK